MVYNYTNVGAMGSQSNGGLRGQNFQNVSIVFRRMAFCVTRYFCELLSFLENDNRGLLV